MPAALSLSHTQTLISLILSSFYSLTSYSYFDFVVFHMPFQAGTLE